MTPDGPRPPPSNLNLNIATSLDALGSALSSSSSLVILADSEPLAPGAAGTLLSESSTPDLAEVVIVTKLGASTAKSGIFGGGDAKLRECEEELKVAAEVRGVKTSVLRVGTLKGGGPGAVVNGEVVSGEDKGLDKYFYDSQAQLEKFMMVSGHDKFTLGCSLLPGDPLKPSNLLVKQGRSISFDPFPDECSTITCAAAISHLLGRESSVDVTISAEKGEDLPTEKEWEAMFSRACA